MKKPVAGATTPEYVKRIGVINMVCFRLETTTAAVLAGKTTIPQGVGHDVPRLALTGAFGRNGVFGYTTGPSCPSGRGSLIAGLGCLPSGSSSVTNLVSGSLSPMTGRVLSTINRPSPFANTAPAMVVGIP